MYATSPEFGSPHVRYVLLHSCIKGPKIQGTPSGYQGAYITNQISLLSITFLQGCTTLLFFCMEFMFSGSCIKPNLKAGIFLMQIFSEEQITEK